MRDFGCIPNKICYLRELTLEGRWPPLDKYAFFHFFRKFSILSILLMALESSLKANPLYTQVYWLGKRTTSLSMLNPVNSDDRCLFQRSLWIWKDYTTHLFINTHTINNIFQGFLNFIAQFEQDHDEMIGCRINSQLLSVLLNNYSSSFSFIR